MNLQQIQKRVAERNLRRGYTTDLLTLTLGVCEEAGELAKSVNWSNPEYVPKKNRPIPDSIEHEIADLLIYIISVANVLDIDLEALLTEEVSPL